MAFVTTFPRFPARATNHNSCVSRRTTPTAVAQAPSESRRKMLQLCAAAALATLGVNTSRIDAASALSMEEGRVGKTLSKIAEARLRAAALRTDAAKWPKTTSVDDSQATLRVMAIWLEPARLALAAVPDLPDRVDIGDRSVVRTKAGLLLGHMLELGVEADGRRSEGIVRELDEFVETADEVLALPSLQRFIEK